MGLSDEGLLLSLVLVWVPVVLIHVFVLKRALGIVGRVPDANINLIRIVTFLLILFVYTIACTVTMYAAFHDKETPRPDVVLAAELFWLLSPLIASLSVMPFKKSDLCLYPRNKTEWILCAKRGLVFGIPFCFVFGAGDQVLRQLIAWAVTGGDFSTPVPLNESFLNSIGESFGYLGTSGVFSGFIGILSNLTIGPFINLFAPESDSVFAYHNPSKTGIALYFLYAIPEEIGWTGTLYPMLIRHLAPSYSRVSTVGIALVITGLAWGLWHCPLIVLKWTPGFDMLGGLIYNGLFIISCVATRIVLISLVWPVHSSEQTSHLLDIHHDQRASLALHSPSILPAVFAHASLNCWWNFYSLLFDWEQEPVWSLLTGSEFSILATAWQSALAALIIRNTFKVRESPRTGNT